MASMRDVIPLLSLTLLKWSDAHVALMFPEPRYPALDFLDTSRTMGPCGVPKQRKPQYTNLSVGSTYNFTWRLQYPHQGGYRITLTDKDGNVVEELAPTNGVEFTGTDDQISQSHKVRVTRACSECTVILERQALEWGTGYRFRSCADVNVLETVPDNLQCSSHGTKVNGRCACEPGYNGDICQYKTNCHSDEDCLNGGKCIVEFNSMVFASCYCSYGFFGKNCEKSYVNGEDECFAYARVHEERFNAYGMFDPDCYHMEKFSDGDFVYYRKTESDVEIILDFASTSWVSIGWRPEDLDKSCRLFPDLEGVRTKRSGDLKIPPLTAQNFSYQSVEKNEASSPSPHTNGTVFNRNNPPAKVAQEGPRPIMPRNNGLLASALHAPLHPMDCVDVLIGAVRNGRIRVQDCYSRDRSTPLEDYYYEGEMSLVATAGREVDGRTVIMFRRSVKEIEPTDHPLGPGRMFVVWAKGQQQDAYVHRVPSALEHSNLKVPFYVDDIVKYHGSKNRGTHFIDFTIPIKLKKSNDARVSISAAAPAREPEENTTSPRNNSSSISPLNIAHTTPTSPYYFQEVDDSSNRAFATFTAVVTALIVLQ
ncbi:hypothetical protein V3C99_012077 [Haemonchus contortus]